MQKGDGELANTPSVPPLHRETENEGFFAMPLDEHELRQRLQELDTLVRFAPGGIFKYSAAEDEQFTFINDNMLKMLGYTRDEFVAKFDNRFSQMVWHEDRERVLAEINSQIAQSDSDVCNYRIEKKNGELMWVHDVGHLVVDDDGSRWFYVVILDKTAQMQTEAALEEQKHRIAERYAEVERMRSTMDKTALGAFDLNLTQNTCIGGSAVNAHLLKLKSSGTVDGFFAFMYEQSPDTEQLSLYSDVFNRRALLDAYERGETSLSFEHRLMIEPDRSAWIRTNVVVMKNPNTDDVECHIYANNIDAEKTIQQLSDKLIDLEYEFVALIDVKTGILTQVRENSRNVLITLPNGLSYTETHSSFLKKLVTESEYLAAAKAMDLNNVIRELKSNDVYTCSFSVTADNGLLERKQWSFSYLDESRSAITYTRRDVTDIYRSEMDEMTNLLNRGGFFRAVHGLLAANPNVRFCIIRFDIDHFKVYNDLYGICAGDALLTAIGRALNACCVLPLCVCAHLEGDHFILCIPTQAANVKELQALLMKALVAERPDFSFVLRFGMYIIDETGVDISIMYDRALMALRSTKGDYNTNAASYDVSMRDDMLEKQELAASMETALANGEFGVYLQPQYDQTTGSMVGAEALARWFRDGAVLSPDKFIPLFEKNGFIMRFDEYIWESVCRLLRKWLDEGRSVVPISVNVSRLDIYNPNLLEILCGLIKKYNLSTELLRLEVTETAYTQDPAQLAGVVGALKNAGFFIEMDDFGSGYSSLNMLNDISVDLIKLDMRFLTANGDSDKSGVILNSIVRLTRWLNIPVLAEGVETTRQADFLKTIGCNMAQGYLYARPVPLCSFEKLLESQKVGQVSSGCLVTSHFDSKEFWQVESQATVIFNSFVGAACLVEYRNGEAELLRANDRFYEETGAPRTVFAKLNGDLMGMVYRRDRNIIRKAVATAIRSGDETLCEARWNWPHGQDTIWLRTRMRVIARSGERCVFYITLENTTERKKMEETLRIREEELRLAMAQTGRTLAIYDIASRTLTISPEYAKQHGLATELHNIPHSATRIVSRYRAGYNEFYEKMINGEKSGSITTQISNANGSYSWERYAFTAIFSEDGAPQRAVITVEDVTNEMERRAEEERNRVLVENFDSLIFDYDYGSDTLTYKVKREGSGFTTERITNYMKNLDRTGGRIHPDYVAEFHKVCLESSYTPTIGGLEYMADLWGKGYCRCSSRHVTIANESGKVYRMVGVVKELEEGE